MTILLLLVIGLVLWSVRLLQGAYKLRDFSLLLASGLVAVSAGGVIFVYSLMNGCVGYLSQNYNAQTGDGPPPMVLDIAFEPQGQVFIP
ncbi:hypothetical protein L3556_14195 [Candidatus Synechococcus calcipolaris G9]|uniref:Uncharacterized protein n=1 Tax=Candidatus Synechococcus calcipolaris G9 TaxID=1497997 RepID=A0ABT6F2L5_9SYNE|nr:hypothetical protein [Candidatus Synechococcus calcipolaris]MDG2992072.1 hypothetical protein [Candidatus Synechococcus calcipolaris G9]